MVVPIGEGMGCGWSDPLAHTLRSVTVEVLLMLFSFGASYSCFGRGGGGDNAACADRVPRSAHILVCLRISHGVSGRGRRSL